MSLQCQQQVHHFRKPQTPLGGSGDPREEPECHRSTATSLDLSFPVWKKSTHPTWPSNVDLFFLTRWETHSLKIKEKTKQKNPILHKGMISKRQSMSET